MSLGKNVSKGKGQKRTFFLIRWAFRICNHGTQSWWWFNISNQLQTISWVAHAASSCSKNDNCDSDLDVIDNLFSSNISVMLCVRPTSVRAVCNVAYGCVHDVASGGGGNGGTGK
jgi:hypothetical protein